MSKKQRGFTLIELMVVVAIIGILMGIAIPQYGQYVRRAQRSDATAVLLLIASEQEKYYLNNNTYTTDLAALNITGSENGYYDVVINAADVSVWDADATARAGGPQRTDDDCQKFTYNSLGTKGAEDSASADSTDECWR
jgi:type IV pilus assembly protein PilE